MPGLCLTQLGERTVRGPGSSPNDQTQKSTPATGSITSILSYNKARPVRRASTNTPAFFGGRDHVVRMTWGPDDSEVTS
ncbi:hypothetical protein HZ326_11004 [Fusarium oxysporum f. sp. albedinis]|nr:hypothetical protein HZ326_11004 [Fusarium oxysporum f. sp. albedinis]